MMKTFSRKNTLIKKEVMGKTLKDFMSKQIPDNS